MPTRRDCRKEGHILVEGDPECLSCAKQLERGDWIGKRVSEHRRHLGELTDPADCAPVREWGTAGLDGAA